MGNHGGYPWMQYRRCPKCGLNKRTGHYQISTGRTECWDAEKCRRRAERKAISPRSLKWLRKHMGTAKSFAKAVKKAKSK